MDNPVPQDLTATPTTDYGPSMACMCEKCGAMVEAIFQPVGRMVCQALGKPLPCTDEFEACQAATTRPDGYTGTQADMNLVYPAVSRERARRAVAPSCLQLTADVSVCR